MTDDLVERVAQAISEARTGNSLSWRHYIAEAQAAIAAMQADAAPVAHCGDAGVPLCSACSVPIVELVQQPGCGAPMPVTDAAPVAWMYKRGSERKVYVDRSQAALACGYVETPLYAHPPVDDHVSTSKPVDDRGSGLASDKGGTLSDPHHNNPMG